MRHRSLLWITALAGAVIGCTGDDGADGSSCTITPTSDGSTITCSDGSTVKLNNGNAGPAGQPGSSCRANAAPDGGGAQITCTDGSSFIIRDGRNGGECNVASRADGTYEIKCPDGSSVVMHNGASGTNGSSCGVSVSATGAIITCTNGTTATISNGTNGSDGTDGTDGIDAALKAFIIRGPANPTDEISADFVFDCTYATCSFECQLDSGGFSGCTSPTRLATVSPGAHTFSVRARVAGDGGSLESPVATYSWTSAPIYIATGRWMSGDLHTHTFLTDGSHTQADVLGHAFDQFQLDWFANSEHGGKYGRDAGGYALTNPMYRWQSVSQISYPLIKQFRAQYASKLIIQGLEWNVPSHEHSSVGIIIDEPSAVAAFEYMFDASDNDTSRATEGLTKQNANHAAAVAGASWLQAKYGAESYFVLNHPSRKLKYTAAHMRDFNDAAPDVAFGFEGFPGHQKEPGRGGYSSCFNASGGGVDCAAADWSVTQRARTWGGADLMVAKTGGLWDALLGEGRRWWAFVNSDFHSSADDADFWPGQYARTWVYVEDRPGSQPGYDLSDLLASFRAGRLFSVHGDLIDGLDVKASGGASKAMLGDTLTVPSGSTVTVTVRFRTPFTNAHGDAPVVDHVDVIQGDLTTKAAPGTPAYSSETNPSAHVAARYGATGGAVHGGVTAAPWSVLSCGSTTDCGWTSFTYSVPNVTSSFYVRLRGTNQPFGTGELDEATGDPLCDETSASTLTNTAAKAWADLWFYSSPIFVRVQ